MCCTRLFLVALTEDKVDELRGTVTDLEQTVDQQADEIEKL